jgi:hypothetical protein
MKKLGKEGYGRGRAAMPSTSAMREGDAHRILRRDAEKCAQINAIRATRVSANEMNELKKVYISCE